MLPAASPPVIRLRGVRHNNLKHLDLDLPLHRLIVLTGLSGSGKSSLAFDTLYAEGQRRYLETFSPYARQFFDRMDKPQVDRIEGIPPAIAIEQRNAVRTTRSTVGTMTEICDYLKVLWPHVAPLHCRQCGQPVHKEPPQRIWDRLRREWPEAEVLVSFDLPLSAKLSLDDSVQLIGRQGYRRLVIEGAPVGLDEALARLRARPPASLTVVQDRLRLSEANRARFLEASEQAYRFGQGELAVRRLDVGTAGTAGAAVLRFSARHHCATCDVEYREPTSALFSFNHPLGACPTCRGFGRTIAIDFGRALPDRKRTLAGGAVKPWRSGQGAECQAELLKFCRAQGVPTNVPFHRLSLEHQRWVIEGDPDYGGDDTREWPYAWYGVKGYFRWLESKAYKMHVRVLLSRYRRYQTCPACHGRRFQPETLLYRLPVSPEKRSEAAAGAGDTRNAEQPVLVGLSLADFYALPAQEALACLTDLVAARRFAPQTPLGCVLAEVQSRLGYLVEAGLGYLTLDRPTRTLSGGETERVNLTACLGTRLVNTLFVLDEPSVGLHARDTARLVSLLERLRDAGNTVVVVEHEAGVIRAADHVVDLGPGSGERGGQIVFQGPFTELLHAPDSLTGRYLSGRQPANVEVRRPVGPPPLPALTGQRSYGPTYPPADLGAEVLQLADALPGAGGGAGCATGRPGNSWLTVRNASRHNLKNLTVALPLHRLVCVTGVSGSGKTTLIKDVLLPATLRNLDSRYDDDDDSAAPPIGPAADEPDEAPFRADTDTDTESEAEVVGWEILGKVVLVDQSPIGHTPRSNPAVYVGAFDDLRELYAQTDGARQRGLDASAFSFNSHQGQCERCRGAGFERIEMQFLSDVFIRCPDCGGRRYRPHILEVVVEPPGAPGARSRCAPPGRNIAELLAATVDDAVEFLGAFAGVRSAQRAVQRLRWLQEVGLGYLCLGQAINTLSGGESQRLKLVSHLAETGLANSDPAPAPAQAALSTDSFRGFQGRAVPAFAPGPGQVLFLFDEPTIGLHFHDVRVLLQVFQRLVEGGHSVVVIEHNLQVIWSADWVIDLGPEAGDAGGQIVVQGAPAQVAACDQSHTGLALREFMASPGVAVGSAGRQGFGLAREAAASPGRKGAGRCS
jgi:excinuclease ABC subunit A